MKDSHLKLKNGSSSQRSGAAGERRAVLYLRLHGYRILERNYLFGHKEIDIIASKGDTIAFIEVKSRNNASIRPMSSVNREKRANALSASGAYIAAHGIHDRIIRYDVIEVDLGKKLYFHSVTHIKNAFTNK